MISRAIIAAVRPETPDQLASWIEIVLGLTIVRTPRVDGHSAPMSYLEHAFLRSGVDGDSIVWANRGGGKTQLGAIATLLDLIFKPGVNIRILGGSLEQSSRMFSALTTMIEQPAIRAVCTPRITGRTISCSNGSRVDILPQSERAVRGQRVHVLRCDEVDLFDEDVWTAAQLTTRSGWCGDQYVHGTIEAFSTMHRPAGLMQRLVTDAERDGRPIHRWNIIDTLEQCDPVRECRSCPLESSCSGRAKTGGGFVPIDDAIRLHSRVDATTWSVEMVGDRPDTTDLVFPAFTSSSHVISNARSIRDAHDVVIGGDSQRGLAALLIGRDDADVVVVDECVSATGSIFALGDLARSKGWRWPPTSVVLDRHEARRADADGRSVAEVIRRCRATLHLTSRDDDQAIATVRRSLRNASGRLRLASTCDATSRWLSSWRANDRATELEAAPIGRAVLTLARWIDHHGVRIRLY